MANVSNTEPGISHPGGKESMTGLDAKVRKIGMIALILLGSLFTGCLSGPSDAPEGHDPDGSETIDGKERSEPGNRTQRDLRFDLTEDDQVEAPVWETGDWFRFNLDYPWAGFDSVVFDVAVVDERDDAWVLATDDRRISKQQALSLQLPFLGEFQKEDLGMKNSFAHWDWVFDFPLYHNKTWNAEMEYRVWDNMHARPLVVTANYSAAIETHLGARPGFTIVAYSEGRVFAEYDYVPAIGWFSNFNMSPRSGDDWGMQLETTGQGTGWSGSYYVHDAEFLMYHTNQFPWDYDPFDSFNVADDAAFVSGGIFVWTVSGAQVVRIVPPEGEPVEVIVVAPPPGAIYDESYEVPAEGGRWEIQTPGVGEVFVFLDVTQIWEDRFEL